MKKIAENYDVLDITKFIMAFLVICVHIKILPNHLSISHMFTNAIGRVGVPFFFVCSGFLFFQRKNALEVNSLIKTLKRILILFVGWTVFYGITLFFVKFIHTEEQPFIRFLQFLFRHLILNPFAHLWFLPALMIGLTMAWFFLKFNLKKIGLLLAILCYIIGILGDTYYAWAIQFEPMRKFYDLYYQYFTTTRNGVFFGFPLVYLSIYLSIYRRRRLIKNIMLSSLFFVLLLLEYFWIKENKWSKDYNMYLSLIPFTKFLFDVLMDIKITISKKWSLFFREYSMGLYFIHPFWLNTNVLGGYVEVVLASLMFIFVVKIFKIPILNNLLK